ncbi:MAG: hypothetical protein HQL01_12920 [Nitrospirae bacterium]|nr:hypothetical protein [Nitrospirota bacterium]
MSIYEGTIEVKRADDGSFIIEVPIKAKPPKKGEKAKGPMTVSVEMDPKKQERTYTAKTIETMLSIVKKAAKALTSEGVDEDDISDKQSGFDAAMAED